MEDPNTLSLQHELYAEQIKLENMLSMEPIADEVQTEVNTLVWTDGACRHNQDSRFRRAGCGVFFGVDDPRNVSCPLYSIAQSNNRAELMAFILVVRACLGSLEVRTDSEYVLSGFDAIPKNQQRQLTENLDLWKVLMHMIDNRSAPLTATKVKGHAKK